MGPSVSIPGQWCSNYCAASSFQHSLPCLPWSFLQPTECIHRPPSILPCFSHLLLLDFSSCKPMHWKAWVVCGLKYRGMDWGLWARLFASFCTESPFCMTASKVSLNFSDSKNSFRVSRGGSSFDSRSSRYVSALLAHWSMQATKRELFFLLL